MKKNLLLLICSICTLLIGHAQEYRSIEIVHPQGTFYQSGLNDQGQISGSVLVDADNFINHALRYEPDGSFTMLTLGADGESATASDINDLGHVIGTIQTDHFTSRYVIWESPTEFRELEQPDGFFAIFLKEINNQGEAVGHTATTPVANQVAFFWDVEGNLQELPQPGHGAEAIAINDHCQIVGRVYDADENSMPVLWQPINGTSNRSMVEFELVFLGSLGGRTGRANDINNLGQVVGFSAINDSTIHGFFWEAGEIRDVMDNGGNASERRFDALNSSLYEISDGSIGVGFSEGILGTRIVQLGDLIDFNNVPFTHCDGRALLDPTVPLPATFIEINGQNQLTADSRTFFSNSTLNLDSHAPDGSGSLGLMPYNNFLSAEPHLIEAFANKPAKTIRINAEPGIYAEDKWTFDGKLAERFSVRSDNPFLDESVQIDDFEVGEDVDVQIVPRLGLTYSVNGSVNGKVTGVLNIKAAGTAENPSETTFGAGSNMEDAVINVIGNGNVTIHLTGNSVNEFQTQGINIGSASGSPRVDIESNSTTVNLVAEGIHISNASVNVIGINEVVPGNAIIDQGVLKNEHSFFIDNTIEILNSSIFESNILAAGNNSTIVVDATSTLSLDLLRSAGDLILSGNSEITIVELNGEIQQLDISSALNFDPDKLIINNVVTNANAGIKTDKFALLGGILNLGENQNNTLDILNEGHDNSLILAADDNIVQLVDKTSFVSAPISRVLHSAPDDPIHFILVPTENPIGFQLQENLPSPQRVQISEFDLPDEDVIGTENFAPTTVPGAVEGEELTLNSIADFAYFFAFSLGVGNEPSRSFEPLEVNIRISANDLTPVEDPNQYRILQFSCDGKFIGIAGAFVPFDGAEPTSAMYTGFIDSTFNISHTGVTLDSCNYLVLAKGETSTAVHNYTGISEGFTLIPNFPNPFHEVTEISYDLPIASSVHLSIYNLLGQSVRTLVDANQIQGNYVVSWDGRNDLGAAVTSGVYYCQIEFTNSNARRNYHYLQKHKMIFIK